MSDVTSLSYALGVVILIGGSALVLVSRVPSRTISQLRELNAVYEQRLHILEEQNIENVKHIGELQGQVKAYKELPLRELADGMKQISQVNEGIAASNEKILSTLQVYLTRENAKP
jgi:hypothetical protein